jgi:hypothetical protein
MGERATIGEMTRGLPLSGLGDYRTLWLAIDPPLTEAEFGAWLAETFKEEGPALLWGKPIVLGPTKAHVYGLDRATYRQVHLECKAGGFFLVAPQDGDTLLPAVAARIVASLGAAPSTCDKPR